MSADFDLPFPQELVEAVAQRTAEIRDSQRERIAPQPPGPADRGTNVASPWLTISEAAEYLRVGASTLRKAVARNDGVPHRHVGRRVVLNKTELDRWLDTKPGVRVS